MTALSGFLRARTLAIQPGTGGSANPGLSLRGRSRWNVIASHGLDGSWMLVLASVRFRHVRSALRAWLAAYLPWSVVTVAWRSRTMSFVSAVTGRANQSDR